MSRIQQMKQHARMASSIQQIILLAGLSVLAPSLLAAGNSKLETNSPFLPPGYNTKKPEPPKATPKVNGPLSREIEFKGIFQMNGVYEFSIFNKKENRSYWIAENGSENGISVSNFNLDAMIITVKLNNRTEQLSLMTATDSPLPVVASQTAKRPKSPNQLNIPGLNNKKSSTSRSRVIPRRRVILPKKK